MIDFESVDALDTSRKTVSLSIHAELAIKNIASNIRTARLRRRESVASAAQRIGVSSATYKRIEAASPGVSMGACLQALSYFGFADQLFKLGDPTLDRQGKAYDDMHRAKRGHRKSRVIAQDDFVGPTDIVRFGS